MIGIEEPETINQKPETRNSLILLHIRLSLLVFPHGLKSFAVMIQVKEAAFVNDLSLVKDVDVVKLVQQVQAMNRGNNRLIGKYFEHVGIDLRLRSWIYAARGFIQQYQFAVPCRKDTSCKGQPLLLSAGKVH